MWIFPLTAAIIAAVFAGALMRRYFVSHNPAQLVWVAALLMFGIATACDFIGSLSGWTPFIAKLYYVTGATIVVGYLAAGTLYLLAPRPIAHIWVLIMLGISGVAIVLLAGAPTDELILKAGTEPGWKAIEKPPLLTGLAISVNSLGTLILVAGAIYSAVFRRYPAANILIAVGTLIIASGGALTRLGRYEYQSIGQAVGIIVIFIGFLMTTRRAQGGKH